MVEIRRGLSLGYNPPSEQSSVIAMTVPSGKYVDIRFPNSPDYESPVKKDSDKIKGYATAGVCTTSILPGTDSCVPYECTIHAKWEHPIDSSGAFTPDSADIYLLHNGDTMEIGTMMIGGQLHMFKEYWVAPESMGESPSYVVVETRAALDSQGSDNAKGMAMVIGNYCQGILHTEDEFWVERWQLQDNTEKWTKDSRSNTAASDEVLPCRWAIASKRKLGDCITLNGVDWIVSETS